MTAAQRINPEFVRIFNDKFTEDIARQYQDEHEKNCHHWDFTFLLWHRKFVNKFWDQIDLPRTYAVLTEEIDRNLYASLEKTLVYSANDVLEFTNDKLKLNSFTESDRLQMELNIAESMICTSFALDLEFDGENIDFGEYNLSFTSQVEEFHDIIHGETGRGMRRVRTAGGDQCFFVHHAFVDLVFETWLNDKPHIPFPFSKDHFYESEDLREDYDSYAELLDLWSDRYFTEDDYKFVRRITAPLVRQVIVFDHIAHTEDYRRVIMFHKNAEIGRFAILTGRIETCATCARRQSHQGQFLLRDLVPINEVVWNINNNWFTWEGAKKQFKELGMSQPYMVSF